MASFEFFSEGGSLQLESQVECLQSILLFLYIVLIMHFFSCVISFTLSFLLFQNLFFNVSWWSGLTVFKETDFLIEGLLVLHVVLELHLDSLANVIGCIG